MKINLKCIELLNWNKLVQFNYKSFYYLSIFKITVKILHKKVTNILFIIHDLNFHKCS